uniref:Uncharacterized protein n=1 Tax=Panagrolaimus sp. PS1159 TaxID=55785 RepID=A0AC35GPV7_9BILA
MLRAKIASKNVNHEGCESCLSTIIIKKKLSDSEVYEWLLEKADTNFGAQFTNGISTIFLLKDKNVIERVHRLLEQHNIVSQKICGKKCLYSSSDIIQAFRDARIFFPNDINESELLLESTRAYAETHLNEALAAELAAHQISELKGQKTINLV